MKITQSEALGCRQGPSDWFTGTVWVDEVAAGPPPARLNAARVSFAPGARTAWHTHPHGQALHVVSGVGWVQLRGQPARAIQPGDSVWIEPGEVHWHGAAAGRTMVHLAMQNADEQGSSAVWLEQVTEAEYGAAGAEQGFTS